MRRSYINLVDRHRIAGWGNERPPAASPRSLAADEVRFLSMSIMGRANREWRISTLLGGSGLLR
jgi:hypothetical protein